MQASNAPTKLPLPFANAGAKNTIPTASQILITPGAASLTDGFPPLTRTPIAAGGVAPSGLDMNGILFSVSSNIQWENAGAFFPYDATFSTAIGGYPKGALLLRADGAGFWFSTADNNATNPDTGGAGWLGIFAGPQGTYGSRNLVGTNNATTPLSKFDVSADQVVLRNPSTGQLWNVVGATTTNDITLAGPAANGRDQVGAFTASSFIHLYWIWNGATLATLASASAPSVGPTLPSGYTYWCYIATLRLNASSQYNSILFIRGNRVTLALPGVTLASGSATTSTSVSVASIVPAIASQYDIEVAQIAGVSTAGGLLQITGLLETSSGAGTFQLGLTAAAAANASMAIGGPPFSMPNIAQTYFYRASIAAGTTPTQTHQITGYTVPNGA